MDSLQACMSSASMYYVCMQAATDKVFATMQLLKKLANVGRTWVTGDHAMNVAACNSTEPSHDACSSMRVLNWGCEVMTCY